MKRINYIFLVLLLILTGCAVTLDKVMQYGEVPIAFSDSVMVDVLYGFLIVPVSIHGQQYRFLYDTGAPFSISDEIQDKCQFKRLIQSEITDSDNATSEVECVQTDTLWLGETPFVNQTALVIDYTANPKVECLNIDGIIGSNLMHHCNWTIDFENKQLSYYNTPPDTTLTYRVPFKFDRQYNMYVQMKIKDNAPIYVEIDYGSRGSLNLRHNVYENLIDSGVIDDFFIESGYSRSGIIGEEVAIEEKLNMMDSLYIEDILFENVMMSSSIFSLLGTRLLSRYLVSIDWNARCLYLKPIATEPVHNVIYGFSLGYNNELGVYVQSVIQGSKAQEVGLESKMKICGINDVQFTGGNFCEILNLMIEETDTLHLDVEKEGVVVSIALVEEVIFQ